MVYRLLELFNSLILAPKVKVSLQNTLFIWILPFSQLQTLFEIFKCFLIFLLFFGNSSH
jgi:hypothetical protein